MWRMSRWPVLWKAANLIQVRSVHSSTEMIRRLQKGHSVTKREATESILSVSERSSEKDIELGTMRWRVALEIFQRAQHGDGPSDALYSAILTCTARASRLQLTRQLWDDSSGMRRTEECVTSVIRLAKRRSDSELARRVWADVDRSALSPTLLVSFSKVLSSELSNLPHLRSVLEHSRKGGLSVQSLEKVYSAALDGFTDGMRRSNPSNEAHWSDAADSVRTEWESVSGRRCEDSPRMSRSWVRFLAGTQRRFHECFHWDLTRLHSKELLRLHEQGVRLGLLSGDECAVRKHFDHICQVSRFKGKEYFRALISLECQLLGKPWHRFIEQFESALWPEMRERVCKVQESHDRGEWMLDLHGLDQVTAVFVLRYLFARQWHSLSQHFVTPDGLFNVSIMVGKGLHSRGDSVLSGRISKELLSWQPPIKVIPSMFRSGLLVADHWNVLPYLRGKHQPRDKSESKDECILSRYHIDVNHQSQTPLHRGPFDFCPSNLQLIED